MQSKAVRLLCILTILRFAIPGFAQMGYPVKGSWSGDWWLKKGEENHILQTRLDAAVCVSAVPA